MDRTGPLARTSGLPHQTERLAALEFSSGAMELRYPMETVKLAKRLLALAGAPWLLIN